MKLFIDSANLADIEEALKGGLVSGITTNPSLLSKEPKGKYLEHMRKIAALCKKHAKNASLSVEVFTDNGEEMIKQAKDFVKALKYKNLAVKIPVSYKGENYLWVVKELARGGMAVNCTACMSPMQLAMAAAAGAKYVSLFYNRVRDGAKEEVSAAERKRLLDEGTLDEGDFDPNHILRETRPLMNNYPKVEIIAGSIRTVLDIKEASLNGAHIVTASLKILKSALLHFKTDHGVGQFMSDFASWLK